MRPGPNGAGLSRKAILAEIDHSLRRLGTDYVDLYQIHRMDNSTPDRGDPRSAARRRARPARPATSAPRRCPRGSSARRCTCAEQHGWARFVSMQDHYNLLAREEEREMLPLCADQGVGTIPWSPLARGRLTRDPRPGDQAVTKRPVRRPAVPAGSQRSGDHRRGRRGRQRPRGQPCPDRTGLAAPQPGRRRPARRREQDLAHRRRRRLARDRPDRRGGGATRAPLHATLRLPGHLRRRRARPHLRPDRHQASRHMTNPASPGPVGTTCELAQTWHATRSAAGAAPRPATSNRPDAEPFITARSARSLTYLTLSLWWRRTVVRARRLVATCYRCWRWRALRLSA